ncbi:MAG TPA: TetR/AcrR family transcriptional regulator [Clostridiales bacterium]|nr:TetR/AcrR family transcriptional regulator [Clostridiales bacterium]
MAKETENRSVRNTKRRLKESLMTLLKEKPAPDITVKDLCELADINRGTFYYHYTDIFDMIKKVEEDFFNEFNELIQPMKASVPPEGDPYLMLTKVFSFFDKHEEWSQIMLGPNGDMSFIRRLKNLVDEKCSSLWKEVGLALNPHEYELFNSFIINGYIGLLETWLKTGRKQKPEEMAGFVTKIIGPTGLPYVASKTDPAHKKE